MKAYLKRSLSFLYLVHVLPGIIEWEEFMTRTAAGGDQDILASVLGSSHVIIFIYSERLTLMRCYISLSAFPSGIINVNETKLVSSSL